MRVGEIKAGVLEQQSRSSSCGSPSSPSRVEELGVLALLEAQGCSQGRVPVSQAQDTEPGQAEGAGSSSRPGSITSLARAGCRAEPRKTLTVTPQHTSCAFKSPKPRKITGTMRVLLSAGRRGRHFQVLA